MTLLLICAKTWKSPQWHWSDVEYNHIKTLQYNIRNIPSLCLIYMIAKLSCRSVDMCHLSFLPLWPQPSQIWGITKTRWNMQKLTPHFTPQESCDWLVQLEHDRLTDLVSIMYLQLIRISCKEKMICEAALWIDYSLGELLANVC